MCFWIVTLNELFNNRTSVDCALKINMCRGLVDLSLVPVSEKVKLTLWIVFSRLDVAVMWWDKVYFWFRLSLRTSCERLMEDWITCSGEETLFPNLTLLTLWASLSLLISHSVYCCLKTTFWSDDVFLFV